MERQIFHLNVRKDEKKAIAEHPRQVSPKSGIGQLMNLSRSLRAKTALPKLNAPGQPWIGMLIK